MFVSTLGEEIRIHVDGPTTIHVYRDRRELKRRWWHLPFRRRKSVVRLALDAPPEVKYTRLKRGEESPATKPGA